MKQCAGAPIFTNPTDEIRMLARTCGKFELTGDDAWGSPGGGAIILVVDHAVDAAVLVVEATVAVLGAPGTACRPRSIAHMDGSVKVTRTVPVLTARVTPHE